MAAFQPMVNLLCNEMWGKECLGTIEKQIMAKLRLVYKNVLVNGEKIKSRSKLLVRLKQTLFIDVFRTSGLDRHNEVIYKRFLDKPMKGVKKVVNVTETSHGLRWIPSSWRRPSGFEIGS